VIWNGLLAHRDDAGSVHMSGGSVWALISVIAFSIFLISIAWMLMRPTRESKSTAAAIATERFAHGEISVDEFSRALRDLDTPRGHRRGSSGSH
jgi:uncharacterized membrane protein